MRDRTTHLAVVVVGLALLGLPSGQATTRHPVALSPTTANTQNDEFGRIARPASTSGTPPAKLLPNPALAHPAFADTAAAGPDNSHELTPLVGSSRYLGYSGFVVHGTGIVARNGHLFVTTLHGRARLVSTTVHDNDPLDYSLAGSMLVYVDDSQASGPETVDWWNLKTGKHGTNNVEEVVAAAPGGWITQVRSTHHPRTYQLYLNTPTGHVTHLGTPDPDGMNFGVTVGGHTLVAYSEFPGSSIGSAEWMSFAHPGVYHRLFRHGPIGTDVCKSVASNYFACFTAGHRDSERLYTTKGKLGISTDHPCANQVPAVAGDALAWVTQGCHLTHRLKIVSQQRKVTTVVGRFGYGTPVAAFGRIVLGNDTRFSGGFTALDVVTSAGHKRQLFRALVAG